MSREGPTIAAVIPAWNAGGTLAEAIGSVLRQTGDPIEIVVVDDGGARPIVEGFAEPRVHVVEGTMSGAGAARNIGLRAANADWAALLDADDIWLDGYLERLREVIAVEPEAGACFAAAIHVSEDGEVINLSTVRARDATLEGLLMRRIQPTTSATAVNRSVVLALDGFAEDFLCPAGVEDIDLWWRIASIRPCVVQPVPLVRYVVHERRDRSRSRDDLRALARDRRRCIERLRGNVQPRLFRLAAAQHLAIMARYWLVAGYSSEARREALTSLRYALTGNGLAALALGVAPSRVRGVVRSVRRAAIRAVRRA